MALEAKLQTKKDILERYEQIREYRSCFNYMKNIDINARQDVDVFNEKLMEDENFINFISDFARLLVRYKVGINGANGHWNSLTFNDKNIGLSVVSHFIMHTNETMEELLKKVLGNK